MNRGQIFIFEEGRRLKGGVEEYVNGAELQIRRIDRTRKAIRKTFQSQQDFERTKWSTHKNRQQRIFYDAHYYFVCIGQISKCLERLCNKLKNRKLNKIYSELNREFNQEIRNDLEHIDSRVVGKKKIGRKNY